MTYFTDIILFFNFVFRARMEGWYLRNADIWAGSMPQMMFTSMQMKIPGQWRETPFLSLGQFDLSGLLKRNLLMYCQTLCFSREDATLVVARKLLLWVSLLPLNQETHNMWMFQLNAETVSWEKCGKSIHNFYKKHKSCGTATFCNYAHFVVFSLKWVYLQKHCLG